MLNRLLFRGISRLLFSSQTKALQARSKFSQSISKARVAMPLYSLVPNSIGLNFIAPNATIVGDVTLGTEVYVGHGVVIRGDINSVMVDKTVYIGDNSVLHTAASLPSGLSAELNVESQVVVGPGCTLYSCTIEEGAFIGSNSVILEGAKIGKGAIILPNSVVPPGRYVPNRQVWGGNPIKFVRFAKEQYIQAQLDEGRSYNDQFLPYNNAYLYKPSDPENDAVKSQENLDKWVKDDLYPRYDPNHNTF